VTKSQLPGRSGAVAANGVAGVRHSPGKLGGVWCFCGARLPVAALFEHLDQGSTIDEFLEWFPSVGREQVHRVLALAQSSLDQPQTVA
jgi:uncharacterized protein (DUF433 family)